jgi:NADPH:quinone reductase-like Zn-dependent oxidoreductase
MIDAGLVTPALDQTWPLADIAEAMRTLEQGTVRGKIAVTQ